MKIEFKNQYALSSMHIIHTTEMFIDGRSEIKTFKTFDNRTWEDYEFQTVMKQAVRLRIELERSKLVEEYKRTNNRKRITKDVREALTNELIQNLRTYAKTI